LVACDGLDISTLLLGMDHVGASGEKFTLVPPIPPDEARQATLDLLDAGAIRVSFLQWGDELSERWLSTEEARAALSDRATWALRGPRKWNLRRRPPATHSYEIVITPVGEELYKKAHELFGKEMDRSMEEALARDDEFLRRHPDFVQKNEEYLEAMVRWVERGGRKPKRPRFD
jgi:hypothetical protein